MYGASQVLRGFQFAFNERFVDHHLGDGVGQVASLPASTCIRMGSKFRCIQSTPTEMQSMGENDFECLASTGVNSPETILPS